MTLLDAQRAVDAVGQELEWAAWEGQVSRGEASLELFWRCEPGDVTAEGGRNLHPRA